MGYGDSIYYGKISETLQGLQRDERQRQQDAQAEAYRQQQLGLQRQQEARQAQAMGLDEAYRQQQLGLQREQFETGKTQWGQTFNNLKKQQETADFDKMLRQQEEVRQAQIAETDKGIAQQEKARLEGEAKAKVEKAKAAVSLAASLDLTNRENLRKAMQAYVDAGLDPQSIFELEKQLSLAKKENTYEFYMQLVKGNLKRASEMARQDPADDIREVTKFNPDGSFDYIRESDGSLQTMPAVGFAIAAAAVEGEGGADGKGKGKGRRLGGAVDDDGADREAGAKVIEKQMEKLALPENKHFSVTEGSPDSLGALNVAQGLYAQGVFGENPYAALPAVVDAMEQVSLYYDWKIGKDEKFKFDKWTDVKKFILNTNGTRERMAAEMGQEAPPGWGQRAVARTSDTIKVGLSRPEDPGGAFTYDAIKATLMAIPKFISWYSRQTSHSPNIIAEALNAPPGTIPEDLRKQLLEGSPPPAPGLSSDLPIRGWHPAAGIDVPETPSMVRQTSPGLQAKPQDVPTRTLKILNRQNLGPGKRFGMNYR